MKIPTFVPGLEGVSFGDLARATNEVYSNDTAPNFRKLIEEQYGPMQQYSIPSTQSLGMSGVMYLPVVPGPAFVILAGLESIRNWFAALVANYLDTFIPGKVLPAAKLAELQTGSTLQQIKGEGQVLNAIYVAGHSMGGAIATLLGQQLKDLFPDLELRVATFGAPRVFTSDEAPKKGGPWLWRFVNAADLVTGLPEDVAAILRVQNLPIPYPFIASTTYAQTGDGVKLFPTSVRWHVTETYSDEAEVFRQLDRQAAGLFTTARHEHLASTYATRLDENSVKLVTPEDVSLKEKLQAAKKFQLEKDGYQPPNVIPPFDIANVGGDNAPSMIAPFDLVLDEQPHVAAAIMFGPGGWASSGKKTASPTGVGTGNSGPKATMITIPKQHRWSYSGVSGQHWCSWEGQVVVQCRTKGQATYFCRKMNQLLRRLQSQVSISIDQYNQAWVDYLSAATQAGNGFNPVLQPAS